MSTVYARKRSLSEYEFYSNALALRNEVTRVAMNERMVPKRYRFIYAVPLVEMGRSLVYNINRADQFYPNSEENVIERRRYLTLAVADVEQVCLELQSMMELGLPIDVRRLEELVKTCEREIALLRGARKNVRLVGRGRATDAV